MRQDSIKDKYLLFILSLQLNYYEHAECLNVNIMYCFCCLLNDMLHLCMFLFYCILYLMFMGLSCPACQHYSGILSPVEGWGRDKLVSEL